MKLLDKMEDWFGRFAVPRVTLILIAAQVIVYVAMFASRANDEQGPSVLASRLALIPEEVLEGEWWRLLTFAVTPPFRGNLAFAILGWYFFWIMGDALEREWGTFRYNVYLLIGYVATVAIAFALPTYAHVATSSAYWLGSVFLAFAFLYPDFIISLFFVFPVPVKWLAVLAWLGYASAASVAVTTGDWQGLLVIVAGISNFLLFFGRDVLRKVNYGHRHVTSQVAALRQRPPGVRNRCRVCGATNETDPREEFRYCGKCEGDCCYCSRHLKTHDHVRTAGGEGAGQA